MIIIIIINEIIKEFTLQLFYFILLLLLFYYLVQHYIKVSMRVQNRSYNKMHLNKLNQHFEQSRRYCTIV